MIKPCRIHLPRTQEELAECLELDRLGLAGHGDSPGPTLDQIAAYEAREKATQGKIFLQSEMKGCFGEDWVVKGGPGSGNYGHTGRIGQVGGSGGGGVASGIESGDLFPSDKDSSYDYKNPKQREKDILEKIGKLKKIGVEIKLQTPVSLTPESELFAQRMELSRNTIEALDYLLRMPPAVFEQVNKINLYSPECIVGSTITAGGKQFECWGNYSKETKTINAKIPDYRTPGGPSTLRHEIGHAVFHTFQDAADKGMNEAINDGLRKNGYSLNDGLRKGIIDEPKSVNQRIQNFFTANVKGNSERVGFVSDYARSWEKEGIIDPSKPFTLTDSKGNATYHVVNNVNRADNENFAEIWSQTTRSVDASAPFKQGRLVDTSMLYLRKMGENK